MKWDDLKLIAAVRDAGSFSGAATTLNVNETTVARRLNRLQRDLGFPFFDAVDGIRRPTPQCEAVLVHIDQMTMQSEQIKSIVEHTENLSRRVRLSVTSSVAQQLLAPSLASLLTQNPGLRIEIDTTDQNARFERWETDLALRLAKPDKGDFIIRRAARWKLVLLSAKKPSKEPVICSYPQALSSTAEMVALRQAGFTDPPRLTTTNLPLIREIVVSGQGVAVMPDYMANTLSDSPRVQLTPLDAYRDVWLLIQSHLRKDPAVRIVISWVLACLSQDQT